MSVKHETSPLAAVILAWLLVHADGGTQNEVDKALHAIVQQRWTAAERRRALEAEVTALREAGSVKRVRKAAYALTEAGRRAALSALGAASIPAKATWRSIKGRALFARALDIPAGAAAIDPDARAAAVLARHHGIEAGSPPSLKRVVQALVRRALGVEASEPFNVDALTGVVLSRWIQGVAVVPPARPAAEQGSAAPPNAPAPPAPRHELPEDNKAFAGRVLAAARASTTGRFGDNKVFISHVLRQLGAEGFAIDDAEAIKARLVAAHQGGLLSLSRADLVEAMAAEDVDASETRYRRATFHFVRI